jgi:hypothetical protein
MDKAKLIFAKTLGGLNPSYYFRNFVFGLVMGGLTLLLLTHGDPSKPIRLELYASIAINTILYPYSRFVYESVIGFIIGDNIIIGNSIFILMVKSITMYTCWAASIFVAPAGLAYLYFYHSRSNS